MVYLEKLIFLHLATKRPNFYGNRRFIVVFTLVLISSPINNSRILYLFKYFPQLPVSVTIHLSSSFHVTYHVRHPYKLKCKIVVLVFTQQNRNYFSLKSIQHFLNLINLFKAKTRLVISWLQFISV